MWWNGNSYPIDSVTTVDGSILLEAQGLVVMVAAAERDLEELRALAPAEIFIEIRRQPREA